MKAPQKFGQEDFEFNEVIENSKVKIHEAFCNNIDTPSVITEIDEILKKINTYIELKSAKITLLKKAY